MKHESKRTLVLGSLSALLLATMLVTSIPAQPPPRESASKPSGKPAVSASKDRKKPRGRLPAYYGKVVSDEQRQEIYEIQAEYNEQIEKLKEQLASLTAKRDSEVEQILTDTQRSEITKLKQARSSRRKTSSTKDDAESGP